MDGRRLTWKSNKLRLTNNFIPSSAKKKSLFLVSWAGETGKCGVIKQEEKDGFAVVFIIIIPCTLQNPFNPLSDLLLPTAPALWGRESKGCHLNHEESAPKLSG